MLQIGDVFTAASLSNANFAFHDGSVNRKRLEVNGPKSVSYLRREQGPTGEELLREEHVNLDGYDASRGSAEFVVIHTEMSGGGLGGHGPHDVYSDGWGVRAKRLTPDGVWTPEGEEVFFRQSGSFVNMLGDIVKIRRMKLMFFDEG